MMDAIAHRGPDGEGSYFGSSVALGHRRLSLLDLSSGGQPMFNEDNTIVVIFNGEIYNFQELRSELVELGHRFSTDHSDTEVLLHGLRSMGTADAGASAGHVCLCYLGQWQRGFVLRP